MSNEQLEDFCWNLGYYTTVWMLNNNHVLQMYSHAATLAFM